jgi:hypothetical protein
MTGFLDGVRLFSDNRHLLRSTNEAVPLSWPPHQFRTRNNLIKMQRTRPKSNKTTAKSTDLIDIPSLITVWLQVLSPAGPTNESVAYELFASPAVECPHQKRLTCLVPGLSSPRTTAPHLIWLWPILLDRGFGGPIARKGQTASSLLSSNGRCSRRVLAFARGSRRQNRAANSLRRRCAVSLAVRIGSAGPVVGPIGTNRTLLTPTKRKASRK